MLETVRSFLRIVLEHMENIVCHFCGVVWTIGLLMYNLWHCYVITFSVKKPSCCYVFMWDTVLNLWGTILVFFVCMYQRHILIMRVTVVGTERRIGSGRFDPLLWNTVTQIVCGLCIVLYILWLRTVLYVVMYSKYCKFYSSYVCSTSKYPPNFLTHNPLVVLGIQK